MAQFVAWKTSLDGMKTDQMPPMISDEMMALCVWKCQLPPAVPHKQIDPAANHSIFIIAAKLFAAASFFASMPALISFILTLFLLAHHGSAQRREHAAELRAVKGQLFVHMLHSAYFFPQTVDVKWSVSARGKPSLPHWLHLFPSRHRSIAFLVGTPVSPHSHFPIHVIARRLDSFQSAEQSFSIVTNDDPRFNGATQQIAEIRLTNVDAEELLWGIGRDERLKNLERAIYSTFRGRNVSPYIFNILPGMANPPSLELMHQLRRRINTGTILQVGTQRHFHANVQQLARGMQLNPEFCVQNKLITIDKHFRPQYTVDWCKFQLKNVTLLKELDQLNSGNAIDDQKSKEEEKSYEKKIYLPKAGEAAAMGNKGTMKEKLLIEQRQMPAPPVYYIWESVLVFPLLAVFCLLCILCLSFIFFGRREGQHWRDFKTPKDQIIQYLNLRESQRQLREISQQRQTMAAMSRSATHGREQSDALSIGTFLRPRDEKGRSQSQSQSGADQSLVLRQRPEFASGGTLASTGQHSSIGKQTVAEAARANGSALHLYRHPIGSDDEEEEEEERVKSPTARGWR